MLTVEQTPWNTQVFDKENTFMFNPVMDALDRAIEIAGGQKALGAACGVWQSAVSNWKVRGSVPAEYCPLIERATGVRCEELRPDVEWSVVRGTAKAAA